MSLCVMCACNSECHIESIVVEWLDILYHTFFVKIISYGVGLLCVFECRYN